MRRLTNTKLDPRPSGETVPARRPPRRSPGPGPAAARVVAMVAHEIRAPLTTALMYMSVLEEQLVPGEEAAGRGTLSIIRDEVERLDRLVQRVLELQRFGRAVLNAERIDLGRLVADTVGRALVGARTPDVRIDVTPAAGIPGFWDRMAVEQIVRNLLSNALKFGVGHPVRISVGQIPSGAYIVVADQGVGVPKARQKSILGGHAASSPSQSGGLGLGLWLVRQLAEAHGGSISVWSHPGKGARFTVTVRELAPGEIRAHDVRPARARLESTPEARAVAPPPP